MISMTKIRLGVLPCPAAAHLGSGAKAAFGGGTGISWLVEQRQAALVAVRTVDLIPPYTVDNSTSVSAPPERSP